jgi:hypothetical protein
MKTHLLPLATVLAAVLLVAGCDSTGSATRIQEKSAVYSTLTPAEQLQIQNGGIEPGFSQDMVYMSLGKPTRVSSSADGKETTWTYLNYYPPSRTPQANARLSRTGGDARARNATSTEAPNVSTGAGPGSSSSLSSTAASGNEPSLNIPDMPSATLHVVFTEGKLTDMSLEE